MRGRIVALAATAAVAGALLAGTAAAQEPDTLNAEEAFSEIRKVENGVDPQTGEPLFPVPTPVATTPVGTFNARNGTFSGQVTEEECTTQLFGRRRTKPVCTAGDPPAVTLNGVHAQLLFQWRFASGDVTVTVNGRSQTVPAGRGRLTVDVGRERLAHWTIRANGRSFADTLVLNRPAVVGVGVFTIEALPVAIVYDPPQDPGSRNSASYTRARTVGMTLETSFSSSSSTTKPARTDFTGLKNFKALLEVTATGFEVAGKDKPAKALRKVSKFLGDARSEVETRDTNGNSAAVTVQFGQAQTCGTESHLGPGRGDRIWYLTNVRVAWFDDGSRTFLALIGSDGFGCPTVAELQRDGAGLSAQSVSELLRLDPFVAGGPGVALPRDRFRLLPDIGRTTLSGDGTELDFQESEIGQRVEVSERLRVRTDTLQKGLLAFVGVGPERTKTVRTIVEQGTRRVTTQADEVLQHFALHSLVNEGTSKVELFHDRLFGTVAIQDPRQRPLLPEPPFTFRPERLPRIPSA